MLAEAHDRPRSRTGLSGADDGLHAPLSQDVKGLAAGREGDGAGIVDADVGGRYARADGRHIRPRQHRDEPVVVAFDLISAPPDDPPVVGEPCGEVPGSDERACSGVDGTGEGGETAPGG